MSCFFSSSSLLVFASASTDSTSISVTLSGSLLDADAFSVGSRDCFSDETLEEADEVTWGRDSV